jgi:hypothetical protein
MSGPLARFGKAGANALAIWAERSAVTLEVIDAYPSAASAIGAAEASRPDVVFGPYGSGPALAAAAASKGVVWNQGGATARLARPAYPRVVNVESPAYRYLAAVLETLAAGGLGEGSEVVIMHVDTGFGREVAEGAAVAARRLGLLRRSVTFRPGRARDVLAQVPAGDVLLSAGSFDDDVVGAQLEWSPPESKSSGAPSVIALRGFTDRASGSTTGQMIPRSDPTASGSPTVTGTRTVRSRPTRLLRPSPRVSFGSAA